jgi:hypothetical protein
VVLVVLVEMEVMEVQFNRSVALVLQVLEVLLAMEVIAVLFQESK